LQALDRLLRRKADVEAGLELAWDGVRCAGARADVGDLERRRLEELVALVPGAARELCERRRDGVHGIVRKVRIGDVTLYTVYGELARQRAAPADLHHVAEHFVARRLA